LAVRDENTSPFVTQLFTWANQFTFLRLALIPFFILAVLKAEYHWALVLLAVAAVSDALDGLLARWMKQRTRLGAYLDPLADKLLLSTSFVVLAVRGDIPMELTVLVLSRDVLMLFIVGLLVVSTGFRSFPPTVYGKLCTGVQVFTVFGVVLGRVWVPALVAKDFLLWLTAALTIISGMQYAFRIGKTLPR